MFHIRACPYALVVFVVIRTCSICSLYVSSSSSLSHRRIVASSSSIYKRMPSSNTCVLSLRQSVSRSVASRQAAAALQRTTDKTVHLISSMLKQVLFRNKYILNVFLDANQSAWFRYMNVASVLMYENVNKALAAHVFKCNYAHWNDLDPFDDVQQRPRRHGPVYVNEAGLYQLMSHSVAPPSYLEHFQDWIFSEVLPNIRDRYCRDHMEYFTSMSQLDLNDATLRRGFIFVATTPSLELVHKYKIVTTTNVEHRLKQLSCITFEDWQTVAVFETSDRLIDAMRLRNLLQPYFCCKDFYEFTSTADALELCKKAYVKTKTRDSTFFYDNDMIKRKYSYTVVGGRILDNYTVI